MRIGLDVTVLYVALGGVYRYDLNLIRAMIGAAPQHQFTLVDYAPLHGRRNLLPPLYALEGSNAQVLRCGGLRHRKLSRWRPFQRAPWCTIARTIDGVLAPPWRAAATAVMRQQLTRHLSDVEVFHSSDVLQWRHPTARNVVTVYDLTALLLPEYHTSETLELQAAKLRFAQEGADAVVAISEATRRDLVAHLRIPPERVHVVCGGVDAAFRPIAERERLTRVLATVGLECQTYILHVGTLEPRKNLIRLVEAYGLLRGEIPPPCPRLVLAGTGGWECEALFRRIAALDLEDSVIWLGPVADELLPSLYNGALLFVYPSLYEGFGLPVLEAMACGVPVVASNAGALPEVVGDAGLLINPLDTHALATAMGSVLADETWRATLAARGTARAREFSWRRAADTMLKVYEW